MESLLDAEIDIITTFATVILLYYSFIKGSLITLVDYLVMMITYQN